MDCEALPTGRQAKMWHQHDLGADSLSKISTINFDPSITDLIIAPLCQLVKGYFRNYSELLKQKLDSKREV